MTKAQLNAKPKKTLVLMATLKRVYKGGKKTAEKKSKTELVSSLFRAYGGKTNKRSTPAKAKSTKTVKKVTRRKSVGAVKYKPKHMRLFVIQYLGATNYQGSRIKITDTRFKKSITKSWGYDNDYLIQEALKWFKEVKIPIYAYGVNEIDKKDYALSPNFDIDLKTGKRG